MEYYEGNSSEAAIQFLGSIIVIGLVLYFLMALFSGALKDTLKSEMKIRRDTRQTRREWKDRQKKTVDTQDRNNNNTPDSKNGF